MKLFTANFEIIEDNNCPLYEAGECFRLTAKAFSPPVGKEVCLILVREMTELLFVLMESQDRAAFENQPSFYSCSGCTGLIKFRLSGQEPGKKDKEREILLDAEQQTLLGKIIDCPLFRQVPAEFLSEMLEHFKEVRIKKNQILIRKGEPNQELYVVLDGELSVDDGPIHITSLGAGEICGEMSYFAGNLAGATVTASADTILVSIAGEHFSKILQQSPSVQLFMARLMSNRLARANSARSQDFDSCIQGRLEEMAPAELFQILHMHSKTGVLTLNFPGRKGEVSFREGCIINARYQDIDNQEAIFSILGERKGVYTFRAGLSPQQMRAAEIGDFMALLMEGVKRVDEDFEDR